MVLFICSNLAKIIDIIFKTEEINNYILIQLKAERLEFQTSGISGQKSFYYKKTVSKIYLKTVFRDKFPGRGPLRLGNDNFFDFITLLDCINNIQPLVNFTEAGMFTIKVTGISPAVADKKLRTAGIFSRMCHRKYATIVILVITIEFTFNRVSGTTGASSLGTPPLNHKIRDHPVKG